MKYTSKEYKRLHEWMNRAFPRAGRCEFCGKRGRTEYASVGHRYTRNRADWFELCPKCHNAFDGPKSPEHRAALSAAMKDQPHVRAAHRRRSKLTAEDVIEIRRAHAAGEATYMELAQRYGVSWANVRDVLYRRTWKEL